MVCADHNVFYAVNKYINSDATKFWLPEIFSGFKRLKPLKPVTFN